MNAILIVIAVLLLVIALTALLRRFKTSLGWKVPRRECYSPSFRIWVAWTIYCHIVLRLYAPQLPKMP